MLLLKLIPLGLAWLVSFIVPRSPKILIFGGSNGMRYADNSRYLFDFLNANSNYKCIWLTKNKTVLSRLREQNFKVHLAHSLKGIFWGLRGSWHIVDVSVQDTSAYTAIGAKVLNLTHGIPIKNLEKIYKNNQRKNFLKKVYQFISRQGANNSKTYILSPNRESATHFSKAYSCPIENTLISNYPRNLKLTNNDFSIPLTIEEANVLSKIKELKDSNASLVGYFPTWRSDNSNTFMGIKNLSQLTDLNRKLKEQNSYLVLKRHSCSFKEYGHSGYDKESEKIEKYIEELDRFLILNFEIDLNVIMPSIDVLVSDYSSIIVDFLLTERPIVLYCYDYEEYKNKVGLYYDYEHVKIGNLITSFEGFLSSIDDQSMFKKTRNSELKKRFFENLDGLDSVIEKLGSRN